MATATHNADVTRASNGIDEEKGLNRTTTGVTMSPELFEKVTSCFARRGGPPPPLRAREPRLTSRVQLYLTPKVPHVGDYNKRFANPTALGFVGSVSPFSRSGTEEPRQS